MVMKLFSSSVNTATNAYKVYARYENENQIKPATDIKIVFFSSNESNYLLVVNEKDKPYTINDLSAAFKRFKSFSVEEMHIYNNDFNFSSREKTLLDSSKNIKIDVNPYSILRIQLE